MQDRKIKMPFFLVQITILQLKNREFQQLKQFLTNSIDDRVKIKAEITSFNRRYYINLKKQVVRSCACGGILGCGVAGAATQNR